MGSESCTREQLSQILSSFIFLLLLLQITMGDAADASSNSIVLGDSLTGDQTRISKSGVFKLGFFSLAKNDVQKWYMGIWYATPSDQTIAWVANRKQPLQNASGIFNLTEEGSLRLFYGESIVWSSEGKGPKKPSSAVIMDSGNLMVLSADNTSECIWQSFDHPGNTWLPGMKFSVTQKLTSWKNLWDPSPGPFALQMDAGADQFVLLWKSKIQYSVSGAWNGQIFSGIPEMADNSLYNDIYNFSFFNSSNDSDKYFTYSVKPNSAFLSRFVVEASGQFRVYILRRTDNEWIKLWTEPEEQCQVYDVCGPQASCNNDNLPPCSCLQSFVHNHSHGWDSQWSSGCVRRFPLKCSHAGKRLTAVRFAELTGKSMPAEGIRYKRQGQRQCEAACVKNCSCTAYAYVVDSTSRSTCFMWFGELLNISDTSNGAPWDCLQQNTRQLL